MSLRVNPTATVVVPSKDHSLRLLKQKVKRGHSGHFQLSDQDNFRKDDHPTDIGKYEIITPQPPSYPRNEDAPLRYDSPVGSPTAYIKRLPDVGNSNGYRKASSNDTVSSPPEVIKNTPSFPNHLSDASPADVPLDMTQSEVGLDNLGNTCFMNSMLQCLLHIEPLVKFFLRSNLDTHLNLASPKKGALAVAFRQLTVDVYRKRSGAAASVSPVNIQKAVSTHAPYLMDFQQQDSQEFLRFLLDGMSEDLCRKHSEQEASSNTATQLGTNPTKSDGKSVQKSSSGILPMLPQSSPNASSAAEFSRTAPASVFDGSAAATIGGAVSTVSQRLREEIQSTRTDRPNSSSLDKTLPHLKQNNNCKIGRIEKEHSQGILVAHPGRESSSKYVARLRHRSELSHDVCDSPVPNRGNNNSSSSNNQENDAVMPFSPAGLSSSEKTVRTSALLKSADEGEDFSEDESPTVSPHKLNTSSQEFIEAELMHLKLRRKEDRAARKCSRGDAGESTACCELEASSSPGSVKSPGGAVHLVESPQTTAEKEALLAWSKYLKLNDSVITDLFAGQLQSTIECTTCHHRSSSYDPFLDLSVPIYRDGDGAASTRSSFLGTFRSSMSGSDSNKSTLEKCLEKFTAEETLDGDNMYLCEKCKAKRKSVKRLSIYKYPQVLVIHIKRFKYSNTRREKLSTDVHFPLTGLDLSPYISPDVALPEMDNTSCARSRQGSAQNNLQDMGFLSNNNCDSSAQATSTMQGDERKAQNLPLYDLIGVSNHHGSLHSGHYIAHVDTTGGRRDCARRWICFNDSRVTAANATGIAGPTAYVLFYKLQQHLK